MNDRNKSVYEKILLYRDLIGIDGIPTLQEAVDELLGSHLWMSEQLSKIIEYMEHLEDQNIIASDNDGGGILDVSEFIAINNALLLERNILMGIIKKNNLHKDYKNILNSYHNSQPTTFVA